MNVKQIAPGEYANYILDTDGGVFTHNDNKLSKYALPEKVTSLSAGHPFGYGIGESGALYLLTGDSPTFRKMADNVKLVDAYWDWCVVVFKDNTMSTYRNGLLFTRLAAQVKFTPIEQLAVAHYITIRTDDGSVYQLDWSATPWKSGTTWYKTSQASLVPRKIALPGAASWITTSRNMFSAAVVNGEAHTWFDSYGAKNMGSMNKIPVPEPIAIIEASDNVMHMIGESGKLYGIGNTWVGEVGDGSQAPEIAANNSADFAYFLFRPLTHIAQGRLFKAIFNGSSYGFRHFAQEQDGTINSWGYAKFGLLLNGIRPFDDRLNVAATAIKEPRRIDIPDTLVVKTTAELTAMIKAGTYPPPEPKVIDPVPVRKIVAVLYDDGKWEYTK